jgi:hypothetical protein
VISTRRLGRLLTNMALNDYLGAPPSTLAKQGQAIYEKQLRPVLESDHSGEFVAIEPATDRYFLGDTATAALVAARNAIPEGQFFLTRVGRGFAHKI